MRRSDSKALLPQSLSLQNTQESSTKQTSPVSNGVMDHSPSNGIKLFIPPLDLSTLHEHIDGIGQYWNSFCSLYFFVKVFVD